MKPMLAAPVATLPDGAGWAFEFKWDGVRALLDVSDHSVRLHSRNGNEITAAYPELIALAADAGDALIDGEIVALADGLPSFERLQTRMHVRDARQAHDLALSTPVTFVAFDLLRRFGVDLTGRPYVDRRATLDRLVADRPAWTISPFFDDGAATLAAARQHGLEGVVAKRLAAPYRAGSRGTDWVKLRFVRAGDFVVVGWEGAADRPADLSSLVLGYYRDGALDYAGKVGSGLDGRTSLRLRNALAARADCSLPTALPPSPGRVATWCEPAVVVEVEFTAWTDDGRLRHPVFRGIRLDKSAAEAIGDG
ncbi:MAG: non-homologous end-joining DNA ligase [Jatrophihabitantaceae bacterium]